VRCVCVADSEADIYEVFAEPRGERPVHRLIRACQDRALDGGEAHRLRDRVMATPALYEAELLIRGAQSQSRGGRSRERRRNRETRRAKVEVRAARGDAATAVPSRPWTAAGDRERRAGPRAGSASGRAAGGVDPGHDAADRHCGTGADGRRILLREVVHRDPVSHAEIGLAASNAAVSSTSTACCPAWGFA